MSTQALSSHLSALSDSTKTTFHLIGRLSKLTFQPVASTSPEGEDEARIEITQDIRASLKQHEDALELLRQEVEDLTASTGAHRRRGSDRDRETARLEAHVARLGEDLKHARSQFRRAQLDAKRASEGAKQKERELYFASLQRSADADSSTTTPDLFAGRRQQQKKGNLTQDELVVGASSDVTAALRRTHNLLTSELSRSRFAQETLDQSTAALADLGERYSGLDTLLASSKSLLGTLVSSQKSDTWYLETAFYLLGATICWLVFRRLVYGPSWWFVWLPLKYLVFQPFLFIFTAFGIRTNSTAAAVSASATLSRPPLRIHPSASGGSPRFKMSADHRPARAIPVGGGGMGAKIGKDGKRPNAQDVDSLSQKIAQMVEESRQEQQQGEASQGEGSQGKEDAPRRADGTVLQERGDKPRNPRKKMWEEDVEAAKYEAQQRDEL